MALARSWWISASRKKGQHGKGKGTALTELRRQLFRFHIINNIFYKASVIVIRAAKLHDSGQARR